MQKIIFQNSIFIQIIIIKYFRHFEKISAFPYGFFFKASGIKVYSLQSNCQLNYIEN